MKGISLPVNTIVIVAIAVLVLMVVGGFFSINVGGSINQIELNTAINKACNTLTTTYNCNGDRLLDVSANFKEPGEETEAPKTLERLCELAEIAQGAEFTNQCISKCGCALQGGGANTPEELLQQINNDGDGA
jgi:hypothetical protein